MASFLAYLERGNRLVLINLACPPPHLTLFIDINEHEVCKIGNIQVLMCVANI